MIEGQIFALSFEDLDANRWEFIGFTDGKNSLIKSKNVLYMFLSIESHLARFD